jgi:hypothetical protein
VEKVAKIIAKNFVFYIMDIVIIKLIHAFVEMDLVVHFVKIVVQTYVLIKVYKYIKYKELNNLAIYIIFV